MWRSRQWRRAAWRRPSAHPGAAVSHGATPSRGYRLKQESLPLAGAANLLVRSLLDRQQFHDPRGQAERLGISSAGWSLFGLAWPSAARLAELLIERLALRPWVRGERALEVGCGLALPSLVGHRGGMDVTASDVHPLASTFLRANLRLNHLGPMKYRHGAWGGGSGASGTNDMNRTSGTGGGAVRPAPEFVPRGARAAHRPSSIVRGRFDLVFGSDLLYERDGAVHLAAFIGRHTLPRSEVWIVDPDRGNRSAFNRLMAAMGFVLTESRLDRAALGRLPAYKGRLLTYERGAAVGVAQPGAPERPGACAVP